MSEGISRAEELAAVVKCEHCGMQHEDAARYCAQCGWELGADTRQPQLAVSPAGPLATSAPPVRPIVAYAPAPPARGSLPLPDRLPEAILVRLPSGELLRLRGQQDYVFGRTTGEPGPPDVDLAQWFPHDDGISRIHATIHVRPDGVYVEDMDSLNETIQNGYRLLAWQWYPLRDGDKIQLGKAVLRVAFQYP